MEIYGIFEVDWYRFSSWFIAYHAGDDIGDGSFDERHVVLEDEYECFQITDMDSRAENFVDTRLDDLFGTVTASLEGLDDSNSVILVLVDIWEEFLAEYVTFHPGGINYRAIYDYSVVGSSVNWSGEYILYKVD